MPRWPLVPNLFGPLHNAGAHAHPHHCACASACMRCCARNSLRAKFVRYMEPARVSATLHCAFRVAPHRTGSMNNKKGCWSRAYPWAAKDGCIAELTEEADGSGSDEPMAHCVASFSCLAVRLFCVRMGPIKTNISERPWCFMFAHQELVPVKKS